MVKMEKGLKGPAVYTVLNTKGEKIAEGDRHSLSVLLEFNNKLLKKERAVFNVKLNNYGEVNIVYTGLNLPQMERYLKVIDKKLEEEEVYLLVLNKVITLVGLFTVKEDKLLLVGTRTQVCNFLNFSTTTLKRYGENLEIEGIGVCYIKKLPSLVPATTARGAIRERVFKNVGGLDPKKNYFIKEESKYWRLVAYNNSYLTTYQLVDKDNVVYLEKNYNKMPEILGLGTKELKEISERKEKVEYKGKWYSLIRKPGEEKQTIRKYRRSAEYKSTASIIKAERAKIEKELKASKTFNLKRGAKYNVIYDRQRYENMEFIKSTFQELIFKSPLGWRENFPRLKGAVRIVKA